MSSSHLSIVLTKSCLLVLLITKCINQFNTQLTTINTATNKSKKLLLLFFGEQENIILINNN